MTQQVCVTIVLAGHQPGRGRAPAAASKTTAREMLAVIILDVLGLALWSALLIADIVGPGRSGPGFRWMGVGLVLMSSESIIRSVAGKNDWPRSQIHVLHAVAAPIVFGCLAVSAVKFFRSGQRRPSRIRASLTTKADNDEQRSRPAPRS